MRTATRSLVLTVLGLMGLAVGCDLADGTTDGRLCAHGTCGYLDDHYNSEFYCPPRDLIPGGWYGYTWHDNSRCHQECAAAGSWGCDASGCDAVCDNVTGTGVWLACTAANGGQETAGGCFLSGSGVNGETISCVCR